MVRLSSVVVVFVALSATLRADEQLKTAVLKLATEMRDAILTEDYAKVIDSTHPNVVKKMGGRDKAIALSKEALEKIKARGIEIKDCKISDPGEFFSQDGNLFVVVPTTNELTFSQSVILSKSYLLGISPDGGKNWTFVEGAGLNDKADLEQLLPKLPAKLVLPAKEKPQVIPIAK